MHLGPLGREKGPVGFIQRTIRIVALTKSAIYPATYFTWISCASLLATVLRWVNYWNPPPILARKSALFKPRRKMRFIIINKKRSVMIAMNIKLSLRIAAAAKRSVMIAQQIKLSLRIATAEKRSLRIVRKMRSSLRIVSRLLVPAPRVSTPR